LRNHVTRSEHNGIGGIEYRIDRKGCAVSITRETIRGKVEVW
jgi:hypothetical protein